MKQLLPIFIFFSCFAPKIIAQRTFKGGLSLGATATQLNGDKSYGYNKIGLMAGVQVSVETQENRYWTTGIAYMQRGSKPKHREVFQTWTIALDYIEIPLLYNLKDWKVEEKGYHKMHVGAGLVYGRLFNPQATVLSGWQGKENYFRKNNLSWVVEATLFQNKHFGYSFRYTRDILRVFQSSSDLPDVTKPLIGHGLTLKTVYIF